MIWKRSSHPWSESVNTSATPHISASQSVLATQQRSTEQPI
uniref:Uncharacterized protein n=1 Tax=Anguilla anguilla TaxID=7936 RepID=A0A0E9VAQ6_ANGAN